MMPTNSGSMQCAKAPWRRTAPLDDSSVACFRISLAAVDVELNKTAALLLPPSNAMQSNFTIPTKIESVYKAWPPCPRVHSTAERASSAIRRKTSPLSEDGLRRELPVFPLRRWNPVSELCSIPRPPTAPLPEEANLPHDAATNVARSTPCSQRAAVSERPARVWIVTVTDPLCFFSDCGGVTDGLSCFLSASKMPSPAVLTLPRNTYLTMT